MLAVLALQSLCMQPQQQQQLWSHALRQQNPQQQQPQQQQQHGTLSLQQQLGVYPALSLQQQQRQQQQLHQGQDSTAILNVSKQG
jgi:VCBS repeat-containing protein